MAVLGDPGADEGLCGGVGITMLRADTEADIGRVAARPTGGDARVAGRWRIWAAAVCSRLERSGLLLLVAAGFQTASNHVNKGSQ